MPAERATLTQRRVATGEREPELRREVLIHVDRLLTRVLRDAPTAHRRLCPTRTPSTSRRADERATASASHHSRLHTNLLSENDLPGSGRRLLPSATREVPAPRSATTRLRTADSAAITTMPTPMLNVRNISARSTPPAARAARKTFGTCQLVVSTTASSVGGNARFRLPGKPAPGDVRHRVDVGQQRLQQRQIRSMDAQATRRRPIRRRREMGRRRRSFIRSVTIAPGERKAVRVQPAALEPKQHVAVLNALRRPEWRPHPHNRR